MVNRPAAQVAVGHDHASGFYAGVPASSARPEPGSGNDVQVLPHLGLARRLGNGLGWDVGVAHAAFLDASG